METDRSTAVHEAGHAVIARVLGLPCGKVTIIGDDERELGHAIVADPIRSWERGDGPRRPLIEKSCIALYSGAQAAHIILGDKDQDDELDCYKATSLLKLVGVRHARFVGDDTWERFEQRLRQRARALVVRHRSKILRVADALITRRTLTGEEVNALIEGWELPPAA